MTGEATILVTSVGAATGAKAAAAALACAGSERDRAGLLVDLAGDRAPRSTLVATAAARGLEDRLAAHMPPHAHVASRGQFCHLVLAADQGGIERIVAALPLVRGGVAIIHLPPRLLQPILAEPRIRASAAMLRADLADDRSLTALVAGDLIERDLCVGVLKQPLGWLASRLALLGVPSTSGMESPGRLNGRLLRGAPGGPIPGAL